MVEYKEPEKRRHPRIKARFIVSYRIMEDDKLLDITQTKNFSAGGLLLTTNKAFQPGTKLALEIRIPVDPEPIKLIGKVIESKEIIKEMIYDTSIEFLSVDEKHSGSIKQIIEHYLKKG